MDEFELKQKSWIAIISYLVCFYLLGSIITVLVIKLLSTDTYSYNVILDALNNGTTDSGLKKICAYANSISNGIIYFIISAFFLTFLFAIYKSDAIKFKNNLKRNILIIIIGGIKKYHELRYIC